MGEIVARWAILTEYSRLYAFLLCHLMVCCNSRGGCVVLPPLKNLFMSFGEWGLIMLLPLCWRAHRDPVTQGSGLPEPDKVSFSMSQTALPRALRGKTHEER